MVALAMVVATVVAWSLHDRRRWPRMRAPRAEALKPPAKQTGPVAGTETPADADD